jgi:hypothetical protein
MGEVILAAMLCGFLNGAAAEAPQAFDNLGAARRVRVDCETPTHVIEMGLDGRASARDSVHQAVFAAELTGKTPVVLMIDTDGVEGRYEQEIRIVARRLGIGYANCTADFIRAWAATSPMRRGGAADDLPALQSARACDLGRVLAASVPGS